MSYQNDETVSVLRRAAPAPESTTHSISQDYGEDLATEISILLPVLNEAPNLIALHAKLDDALKKLGRAAEVIYVDDGSTDESLAVLREIAARHSCVRVIAFKRNHGQTAAMVAGFEAARGGILIPMDADMQNDPADIQRLLDKLDEGYDVVSGWRRNRQDKTLTRKIPSVIANRLISRLGGVSLHDYGCSLKAYRREALRDVRLYGEMHRFIPVYASWSGARITEIPVAHHPRTTGKSKYNLWRTPKVILDLTTIKYMAAYRNKPVHFFGRVCVFAWLISVFAALCALGMWLLTEVSLAALLSIVAVVMCLLGVQFLLMGLLAEMLTRFNRESSTRTMYEVRETIGFADSKSRQSEQRLI